MALIPQYLTVDELLAAASESPDPIAQEIARRMTGAKWSDSHCNANDARGRTLQDIKSDCDTLIIRFTDGSYLVVEAVGEGPDVYINAGRLLLRSERYAHHLMSPDEEAAYIEEKKAEAEAHRNASIERMRRELADLEGNHGAA